MVKYFKCVDHDKLSIAGSRHSKIVLELRSGLFTVSAPEYARGFRFDSRDCYLLQDMEIGGNRLYRGLESMFQALMKPFCYRISYQCLNSARSHFLEYNMRLLNLTLYI